MKTVSSLLVAVVLSTLGSLQAHATVLQFNLNYNFGAADAGGSVLVTITEAVTAGDINVTIINNTLGFLNDLYLNYSPSADIGDGVVYNFAATVGVVGTPAVQYNALQGFAIDFSFPTANSPNRFNPAEAITFDLGASGNVVVNGFNVLGGARTGGDYYASAHVNAIPAHGKCPGGGAKVGDANGGNVAGGALSYDCDEETDLTDATDVTDTTDTTDATVPEPASLLLLGLGLLGVGVIRRRK